MSGGELALTRFAFTCLTLTNLLVLEVAAQSPAFLVKDINPNGDSQPAYLFRFGDLLLFSADHVDYGRELWASDGTLAGTQLVRDVGCRTAPWDNGLNSMECLFGESDDVVMVFGSLRGVQLHARCTSRQRHDLQARSALPP